MHAEVVGRRQEVIPTPYLIEITWRGSNTFFDRRIGKLDADFDHVHEGFDMPCYRTSQNIAAMPKWTNLAASTVEEYFEIY